MKTKLIKYFFGIIIAIIIMACGFSNTNSKVPEAATESPTATETPIPIVRKKSKDLNTTATITPTSPAESIHSNCTYEDTIEILKSNMPYETFSLSYNILSGESYLVYWVIDPSLNAQANEDEIFPNYEQAVTEAIDIAIILQQASPCTAELFDFFNPVIVDENYNGWFSGIFKTSMIHPDSNQDLENLQSILDFIFENTVFIRYDVPEIAELSADACSWEEVEHNVARHFAENPLNFYSLVSDHDGITFYVQNIKQSDNDEILIYMNTNLELSCLHLPINQLSILFVDDQGNVVDVFSYEIEPE
jgi:hypothetical protein